MTGIGIPKEQLQTARAEVVDKFNAENAADAAALDKWQLWKADYPAEAGQIESGEILVSNDEAI